ncbi:hypothetical protein USB125703_00489 [Pseudoclavibacter triregionum]|nr:hypothetical protein USB125703_00489 [Pseudoclavibacter triregionum]
MTDLLTHAPGRDPAALDGELRAFGIGSTADVVTLVTAAPAPTRQLAIAVGRELWLGQGAIIAPHSGHTCIVLAVDGRFAEGDAEARMQRAGRALHEALAARGVPAVIGLGHRSGRDAPGAAGLAEAHRLAERVQASATALGWTSGFATRSRLGPAGALLAGAMPEAIEAAVAEALGPVLENDRARGTRLEAALLAALETSSAAEAAARLHIHPSTVR